MSKGRYIYVLNYKPYPVVRFWNTDVLNCWGRTNWPRPNSGRPEMWRFFRDRFEAEDFLFQQSFHLKRDVKKWRPRRILISKKAFKAIEKVYWGGT